MTVSHTLEKTSRWSMSSSLFGALLLLRLERFSIWCTSLCGKLMHLEHFFPIWCTSLFGALTHL